MPRERITSNGTPDSHEAFDLQVGWSPDQYMQVGIQVSDSDRSITDLLFGGEGGHLAAIGSSLFAQLQAAGWSFPAPPEPVDEAGLGQMVLNALNSARDYVERDGLWVDLRRDEANRAVRFIRKARDAAYGRDE